MVKYLTRSKYNERRPGMCKFVLISKYYFTEKGVISKVTQERQHARHLPITLKVGIHKTIKRTFSELCSTATKKKRKTNFMVPFYGWGSTASGLEPLRGGSLLFSTKFPEIPGTHFIDLGRRKG